MQRVSGRGTRLARRPAHVPGSRRSRRTPPYRDIRRNRELLSLSRRLTGPLSYLGIGRRGRPRFQPRQLLGDKIGIRTPYSRRILEGSHRQSRQRHDLSTRQSCGRYGRKRLHNFCGRGVTGGAEAWRFHPRIVLDATDLGDLLPLSGAEYRCGAESIDETGEPHAQPDTPNPQCAQSYTYTFALEQRPRHEHHVIQRPERYEYFRDRQPYSLTIEVHGGEIYSEDSGRLSYTIFETMPGTKGSLWTYRRLIAASQFEDRFPADITMINWPGNDYRDGGLIDRPAAEVAANLQDAKRVSLGFLYWLQTQAPAGSKRVGAPELMLRPDIMGSKDGLSKHPYIREGRRIRAVKTITEQEVSAEHQPGPRAAHFMDSVGIGWYPIDIHPVAGDVGVSCRTRPFQIPLGALLPIRLTNLIAASKNIGTTHITNGCY